MIQVLLLNTIQIVLLLFSITRMSQLIWSQITLNIAISGLFRKLIYFVNTQAHTIMFQFRYLVSSYRVLNIIW